MAANQILRALVVLAVVSTARSALTLKRLSSSALPASYDVIADRSNPQYEWDKGVAEQMHYDPVAKIAYVVGENKILHVVDCADTASPSIVWAYELDAPATDVTQCGDYVAVGMEGESTTMPGKVAIFMKYDAGAGTMTKQYDLTTGALPDMIKFSKDCKMLLTADEAEARISEEGMEGVDAGDEAASPTNPIFINPSPSVTMFTWADGDLSQQPTTDTITFDKIGGKNIAELEDSLLEQGIGWQLSPFSPNLIEDAPDVSFPADLRTLMKDLEPEYIALSTDGKKAYVCLQEASAIAVVDLEKKVVERITPLALKDWRTLGLKFDASNRDSGINQQAWPVKGVAMPDSIQVYSAFGEDYIVMANEGDAKEYLYDNDDKGWACELRGGDIKEDMVDPALWTEELAEALDDNAKLGRVKFLCSGSLSKTNNRYKELHVFSSRSWSIYRASDMALVYDSGSEVEDLHRKHMPDIFNSEIPDPSSGDDQADEFDSRSDDKGPEVETVEIAMIDGRAVAFVGCERTSTLLVYDISNPFAPVFQSITRLGPNERFRAQKALDDGVAYKDIPLGVVDPESFAIDANKRLFIVAGSVSGRLDIFSIEGSVATSPETPMASLYQLGETAIPAGYKDAEWTQPTYGWDVGAGEQVVYDKSSKMAYVVGETAFVHVYSIEDPANVELKAAYKLNAGGTDTAFCGGYLAVGAEGENAKTDAGQVFIFKAYNASETFTPAYTLTTGALPDHLKFNKDCTMLFTADEGESGGADAAFVNPDPSVTVFKWAAGGFASGAEPTNGLSGTKISFETVAGTPITDAALQEGLRAQGVQFSVSPEMRDTIMAANGVTDPSFYPVDQMTFLKDLEPEYLALSSDESRLFVVLQENSAIATIDLDSANDNANMQVLRIEGLVVRDWATSDLGFDASDRDDIINMKKWNVKGLAQPDTIVHFEVNGTEYIAMANEGDSKEIGAWEDSQRGRDFDAASIDQLDADLQAQLGNNAQLGRLGLFQSSPKDANGKYTELHTASTRSWSVYKVNPDSLELVWDSESQVEDIHRTHLPDIFNADAPEDAGDKFADTFDSRSDAKGPEVETLAIGTVEGKLLMFVASERASTVLIYDMSNPMMPKFLSIQSLAPGLVKNGLPAELLEADNEVLPSFIGSVDPESIFVDEERGILIVAGSVSGMITTWKIEINDKAIPRWSTVGKYGRCELDYTWPQLAKAKKDGLFDFAAGGLGKSTEKDWLSGRPLFTTWVCVSDHECAVEARASHMCFVYHELEGFFVPWGTNEDLDLYAQKCSNSDKTCLVEGRTVRM